MTECEYRSNCPGVEYCGCTCDDCGKPSDKRYGQCKKCWRIDQVHLKAVAKMDRTNENRYSIIEYYTNVWYVCDRENPPPCDIATFSNQRDAEKCCKLLNDRSEKDEIMRSITND